MAFISSQVGVTATNIGQIVQAVSDLEQYLTNLSVWSAQNYSISVNGVAITLSPDQQAALLSQYDTLKQNLSALVLKLP